MSFSALSNEILLEIFEHIANDEHLSSEKSTLPSRYQNCLRCLSLCSWRLNGLATPIFYRTFIGGVNLYLFLRTVITKPDYAQHVRQFVGRGRPEQIIGNCSEQDFASCQAIITAISSSKILAESWIADLQNATWDAMVAVILFFVPNLEVLHFDFNIRRGIAWPRNEYIPHVLKYAASVPLEEDAPASPLTQLWFVSLGSQHRQYVSIRHLQPFLGLKSVSKVHVRGLWDSRIDVPNTFQFGAKDLQINHYDTCEKSVLIGFLRCFSSLERFTYSCTVKGVGIIYVEGRPFAQHLGQAIAHLTHCLEELALYNVRTTSGGLLDSEHPQSIGSLANFEKLRIIRMDAYVLFGPPLPLYADQHERLDHKVLRLVDVLPRSIQEVTLGNCYFDKIKHQLQELLTRRGEFTALRKIRIKIAAFTANEEIRQNLITDYHTAGISLTMSVNFVGASLASPEELDPGWVIH